MALSLGLAFGLIACSDTSADGNETGTNPVTTPGGTVAGNVGAVPGGGAVTPGGTASGGATPGGTVSGGATPGGTVSGGATAGSTGGTAGGSTGGATGGGATGGGNVALGKCDTNSTALADRTKPCGSYVGPLGVEVQLGPYGAQMDPNVGKGFENPINDGDSDNNFSCQLFVAIFQAPQEQTDKLLTTGDLKFDLYTVYHPANYPAGKKLPLITWGNGTCAQPEGYGGLLRYVASFGYIVVAANSRWVGDASSPMTHALDFMFKANDDPASPYYQKIDTTKVAAMGHSQGGMATITAASDARISNVIIFNGGTSASKPFLAISGDRDIFSASSSELKGPADAAPKAAWLYYHMIPGDGPFDGHLTLMQQPERVNAATVNWFQMMFFNDADAKGWFVGPTCKLCGHDADYEYGQHGL